MSSVGSVSLTIPSIRNSTKEAGNAGAGATVGNANAEAPSAIIKVPVKPVSRTQDGSSVVLRQPPADPKAAGTAKAVTPVNPAATGAKPAARPLTSPSTLWQVNEIAGNKNAVARTSGEKSGKGINILPDVNETVQAINRQARDAVAHADTASKRPDPVKSSS